LSYPIRSSSPALLSVLLSFLTVAPTPPSGPNAHILAPRGREKRTDTGLRTADFDSIPKWESHRARLLREYPPRLTRQGFGYSRGNHVRGSGAGEIGGSIQRSVSPAWYAAPIEERTLRDRLSASGKFSVTHSEGGSGMLFGWFHETSRGWRTSNSLAFRLDGNGGNYRVFYEYGTRSWLTGGAGCFEGDAYQTTKTRPCAADGTVHEWAIEYDPTANEGNGAMTFTLDGNVYLLPLAPGHKTDGARFNRFGMFNQQTSGDGLEVYFDDLTLDGRHYAFERDPRWEGRANRGQYADRYVRPRHDFGYSPTRLAGGARGEIGGIVWRDEPPAFFADRVGPLSLRHSLYAEGRVTLCKATSDSAVYIGWFDSASKLNPIITSVGAEDRNVLAVLIEGPSRVGHLFRGAYRTNVGAGETAGSGPLIKPDGCAHRWSIRYTSGISGGSGRIEVTLDGHGQTMEVPAERIREGATFDRFGIFNLGRGGLFVELYLDDIRYSATEAPRQ
jgi:hypothetical protein